MNVQMPNNLDAFWQPFTASRWFKDNPRIIGSAEGVHYTTIEGHKLIDGTGGLWCCNAGHNRKPIVEAIQKQAATLRIGTSSTRRGMISSPNWNGLRGP